MAPQDTSKLLRVVTQRLSSAPSKQLPYVAPYLATVIAQHGKALATSTKDTQIGDAESAVIVHKLKSQLSALLQDKDLGARYAAVILIKATVEAGGWITLQGVGAWARGLTGILGRSDSPSTKKLCIITLTRIFLLTHEHQSLVREITTPSLPGFITACLNLVKKPRSSQEASALYIQSQLLLVVMHALSELIAMHPTSFRPFVQQIQSLTYPLIAPTPSNMGIDSDASSASTSISESARHLIVLLHVCGPKNSAGEEWTRSVDALNLSLLSTADKVFRSVIEHWTSTTGKYDATDPALLEGVVRDQAPAPLALPAWTGISAGIERLDGLLLTLQAFLGTTTTVVVTLPVGNILNMVDRVLSVVPPGNGMNRRVRPEIGRDEREELWAGLSRLHISAIGVYSLVISRMGHFSAAMSYTILEQLLWTFENQKGNDNLRKAVYGLVSQILSTFGPSLPKTYAVSISRCIEMCCEDLLPSSESQQEDGQVSFPDNKKTANEITSSKNADSYLKPATNHVNASIASNEVLQAARELLPLALTKLPIEFLPFSLRCQIDRTAIITSYRRAMLASVMNPTSKRRGQNQTSSILPLFARAYPEALEVEALLRPQMPPLKSRQSDGRDRESDQDENTYMHNHSPVGEPKGFFQNDVHTNGNANVEEKMILGDSSEQVEASSGATEESSSSIYSTSISKSSTSGMREPNLAFPHPSMKRNVREDSEIDRQESAEGDGMELAENGPASKQSRVGADELLKETLLEPTSPNPVTADTGGTEQPVKKLSDPEHAVVSDRQSTLQHEESDESEFEMPILHLDSDTDEGEEDDS